MTNNNQKRGVYKQLTYSDMVKIETLLSEKYNYREIGIKIGKDKTTIYRCLKNNSDYSDDDSNNNSSNNRTFTADKAWEKVCERKTRVNQHFRILPESILEEFIIEKIKTHWSPEQIAGIWTKDTGEAICHETIYQHVYKHHSELVKLYFRRKGKKYQHKRKEKYQILNRRMIDDRPEEVMERKQLGHWEGDTIVGKNHKGAIVTNLELKSGFLIASKIPNRKAESVFEATKEDFEDISNQFCITMTYDNGREFAEHQRIEEETKMMVFFAHPYSPWERGANESVNGLLREFIPKGTDFSKVTNEELDYYVELLNNRPRKRLGYKTPYEVFQEEVKGSCS